MTVDTGDCTGIAMIDTNAMEPWSTQLPREQAEDFIAAKIPLCDVVVTEQLVISTQTSKKGRQVQRAIEMVGLIRTLCRWHGVQHYDKSKPNEAMRFATNARLKMIGWDVPGQDHQRDARRHLLTYLAEHRLIDRVQLVQYARRPRV